MQGTFLPEIPLIVFSKKKEHNKVAVIITFL